MHMDWSDPCLLLYLSRSQGLSPALKMSAKLVEPELVEFRVSQQMPCELDGYNQGHAGHS